MNHTPLAPALQDVAEQALAALVAQGCDAAQASARRSRLTELAIIRNAPALLRSTETHALALSGIWGGRKASTELPAVDSLTPAALAEAAAALRDQAASAPQDEAHAVSHGQQASVVRGPVEPDLDQLAEAVGQLLAFRAAHAPTVTVEEGGAEHHHRSACTLTTGGSHLASAVGWYGLVFFGSAREGAHTSSFDFAGGECDSLAGNLPMPQRFGIGLAMQALARSVHTRTLAAHFAGQGAAAAGDVVLMPHAVAGLLAWLRGQLSDVALLDGSSLYRQAVGKAVASPLLTLDSRFEAPGLVPFTADGFAAPPLRLLDAGRLTALTPTLYASRKLGLPHVPVAADGWQLAAGTTPLATLLAGVPRGALVGRLSMGRPAPNGDFSGVIKNSFVLDGGAVGPALSETMVTGNVAQLLRDVVAVSAERLDTGGFAMPWLRVAGLHFS